MGLSPLKYALIIAGLIDKHKLECPVCYEYRNTYGDPPCNVTKALLGGFQFWFEKRKIKDVH